ncbi:MAG: type II toxin-antitoxin system HigB family toxin [Bacteroidales bacterium]|nr:type II toxin-antitoxin system HigB family toxin [Bacteroidales bacterium]
MRVVSHRMLKACFESPGREDSRVPLERWYKITEEADWKSFSDVKKDFGSVDSVGNQHYVFNIKGNSYRIVAVIKFVMGFVYVRFVGTHEEYDKIDARTI